MDGNRRFCGAAGGTAPQAKIFAGSPTAIEHLTISIGIAVFGHDTIFKRELIEFADFALYQPKASRNRVVTFSDVRRAIRDEVS